MDRWTVGKRWRGDLEKKEKRRKQEQNEATESVAFGVGVCCVWEGGKEKKKRRGWSETVCISGKREREREEGKGNEGEKVERKSAMEEIEER